MVCLSYMFISLDNVVGGANLGFFCSVATPSLCLGYIVLLVLAIYNQLSNYFIYISHS